MNEYTNFLSSEYIIKLDFFEQTFIDEFYTIPCFIKVAGGTNITEYELFETLLP